MPTPVEVRLNANCPVVGHGITLSRTNVFLDYILMSEGAPTCSNIHACLAKHGDIKNIPECLLHAPPKFQISDDWPR
jgi:hypothetical protein